MNPVVRSKFSGPGSALGMGIFMRNPVVLSKFSGSGSVLGIGIFMNTCRRVMGYPNLPLPGIAANRTLTACRSWGFGQNLRDVDPTISHYLGVGL